MGVPPPPHSGRPLPPDSNIASDADVLQIFPEEANSMQCAVVQSAENRMWVRLVGRSHDIQWWHTEDADSAPQGGPRWGPGDVDGGYGQAHTSHRFQVSPLQKGPKMRSIPFPITLAQRSRVPTWWSSSNPESLHCRAVPPGRLLQSERDSSDTGTRFPEGPLCA